MSLETLVIPDGVSSVGWNVFYNCPARVYAGLESSAALALGKRDNRFSIAGNEDLCFQYQYDEGEDNPFTSLDVFAWNKELQSADIPEGVTRIGYEAFRECYSLEAVTLPESLVLIEDLGFCDCDSLQEIEIPSGVERIGYSAFNSCDSLANVSLPATLPAILNGTFANCSALSTLTIPESVVVTIQIPPIC